VFVLKYKWKWVGYEEDLCEQRALTILLCPANLNWLEENLCEQRAKWYEEDCMGRTYVNDGRWRGKV